MLECKAESSVKQKRTAKIDYVVDRKVAASSLEVVAAGASDLK